MRHQNTRHLKGCCPLDVTEMIFLALAVWIAGPVKFAAGFFLEEIDTFITRILLGFSLRRHSKKSHKSSLKLGSTAQFT